MSSLYLIVHADGKLHRGTFDYGEALEVAALAGGVAVELPIVGDFRHRRHIEITDREGTPQ